MSQKGKYQSKTVRFGGKEFTMFTIDGLTWSTRKDELLQIQERQEAQKVTFAQLKGEPGAAAPDKGEAAKVDPNAKPGDKPAVAEKAKPTKPVQKTRMRVMVKQEPKGEMYEFPAGIKLLKYDKVEKEVGKLTKATKLKVKAKQKELEKQQAIAAAAQKASAKVAPKPAKIEAKPVASKEKLKKTAAPKKRLSSKPKAKVVQKTKGKRAAA